MEKKKKTATTDVTVRMAYGIFAEKIDGVDNTPLEINRETDALRVLRIDGKVIYPLTNRDDSDELARRWLVQQGFTTTDLKDTYTGYLAIAYGQDLQVSTVTDLVLCSPRNVSEALLSCILKHPVTIGRRKEEG